MAVRITGGALHGVDAVEIEVEVDLLRRLPKVTIVGLAAHAVQEAAERVRSAIASAGAEFPRWRVIVNLAPADVPKDGTAFDLPVALAILAADGQIPPEKLDGLLAVGELALGGGLRPVRGALALAALARTTGRTLVLPARSAAEAALVTGARVKGFEDLGQVLAWLKGEVEVDDAQATPPEGEGGPCPDLRDVRGQQTPRRALEIAAAGAHHLLLVGPPGCGKTMLAARLSSILPALSQEEALETTRVWSAAGLLASEIGILRRRPFRAPHHTVSAAALVGDMRLRPGEASLAHHGVLFLDEAPEFPRAALEVLRQPLEDGVIRVARAKGTVTYPAAFTLVLAANPCPCGKRGSGRPCQCPDREVERYQRKLSGPLLDRIDLHVPVGPVSSSELLGPNEGEASVTVRARVLRARERQRLRGQKVPNGRLEPRDLARFSQASPGAEALLAEAVFSQGWSARVTHRVQKVARTIADLDGQDGVSEEHMAEALSYRPLDEAA